MSFAPVDWLRKNGARLVRMIDVDRTTNGHLKARVICADESSFVLRIEISVGEFAVKAFNSADVTVEAAFQREIAMLSLLRGRGLTPKLLGYSPEEKFILSEWAGGKVLDEHISSKNIVSVAEYGQTGRYLACLANEEVVA